MLIHGAFRPASRRLVLAVAIASKLCFIGLILVYGRQFLAYGVGAAIAIDSVMVLLFVAYLAAAPRPAACRGVTADFHARIRRRVRHPITPGTVADRGRWAPQRLATANRVSGPPSTS
jgi:hypothetical protein